MAEVMPLRRRNQLAAMRAVQTTAVRLFEAQGFAATTVDEVADESGVSGSTIYRYFGTKEALVLWEERDEVVESELATRLAAQPPVEAFRDAMAVAFGEREDNELFLRRLRLIYAEPEIWSAAALQDRTDRRALALAFAMAGGRQEPTSQDTLAAALCLTALDVAFEQWQQAPTAVGLGEMIRDTLDRLSRNERRSARLATP